MSYLLLPALLALAPAVGQAAPPHPDDAGAAVPETSYRPSQAYRPPEKPAVTPDRHWVEANRTVLGYNPMMLTMPERAPAPPKAEPGKESAPDTPHRHEGH